MAAGENMHQVASGSVDAVVCTLVLCSVKNQEQILQEGCRVPRLVSVEEGCLVATTITKGCCCGC